MDNETTGIVDLVKMFSIRTESLEILHGVGKNPLVKFHRFCLVRRDQFGPAAILHDTQTFKAGILERRIKFCGCLGVGKRR